MRNMADEKLPYADRPVLPDGYGVPEDDEGLLPWSYLEDRVQTAQNYWICTTRPDGRPHAMPVWGVWMGGRFYFDGSPKTRRGRNLVHNPAIVVHLESGDQVVVLEGKAQHLDQPQRSLTKPIALAYCKKYSGAGYAPEADQWDAGGLFEMRPEVVFAWTKFPDDMTRWRVGIGGDPDND